MSCSGFHGTVLRAAAFGLLAFKLVVAGDKALVYDVSISDLTRPIHESPPAHHGQHPIGHQPNGDVDIDALIANMTLREKIAQMTQLDIYSMVNGDDRDPATALNRTVTEEYARLGIGSILNAPFPGPLKDGRTGWSATEWATILTQIKDIYRTHSKTPMLYGIDTIHGATYVRGATLFPQPLGAACSFNLALVDRMGEIEAKDTFAAGIPWVFSPVLGIAVQPKWSRVYETFGEDPHVVSQMGAAIIRGIQRSGKVAACMKHFIGYSNPMDGLDRADNVISDFDLVNYFAPSFLAATRAGVKSAMETYVSVNGVPVIASHKLLTQLLRDDMNFTGLLVSDYSEIDRLVSEHHSVPTVDDAVRVTLQETSLDMNMGPNHYDFFHTVERLVESGELRESRLDESVRRILALKHDLGLFKHHSHQGDADPSSSSNETTEDDPVGSKEDQEVALQLARESIVLLENENDVLPLNLEDPATTSVFLTGPISDNKGYMCGGWSVFWSGSSNSSHFPNGKTLKHALHDRLAQSQVIMEHMDVVDASGNFEQPDWDRAIEIARRSSHTIVVLGEGNYAEKQGDIQDLALPEGQLQYLKALSQISTTKVILVLVQGRPRTLHGAHSDADAVLLSFLPCEQGGQALTDVLVGDVNPSGKLPITYPRHSGNAMPYFHRVNTVCDGWSECDVEWPFGFGLSYSSLVYSDLVLNATSVHANGSLQVTVTVMNQGPRPVSESVLLFLTQKFRLASVPETKMLKQFQKIPLLPGESKKVAFTLSSEDWGFYNPHIGSGFHRKTEPGEYIVSIQKGTAATTTTTTTTAATTTAQPDRRAATGVVGNRHGRGRVPVDAGLLQTSSRHFETLSQSFYVVA